MLEDTNLKPKTRNIYDFNHVNCKSGFEKNIEADDEVVSLYNEAIPVIPSAIQVV